MSSSDLEDCSEIAKVPSSSALTSSSSDIPIINSNSSKKGDFIKDVGRDFVKDVGRDFVKDVGRDFVGGDVVGGDVVGGDVVGGDVVGGDVVGGDFVGGDVIVNKDRGCVGGDFVGGTFIGGNFIVSKDRGGDVTANKDRGGDVTANKDRGGDVTANKDRGGDVTMNKDRGCGGRGGRGGLPVVLIAGVLIAGVLIAGVLIVGVFMLKHKKSSHDDKVPVGASLSATASKDSSWHFPSGDFAFGFQQLENSERFLLCIWFVKISDRTIVWYANGDNPAPTGSIVKLTASGLVLTSPDGDPLWKSDQISSSVVAHGVMHDTGNFVLEDDKSESLWETFKNPTDTMLPGQIIERGGKLSSRQSETNYTTGRFRLDFRPDGNLVFSEENPFCSTSTTNGTYPGSEGKQLVFDALGNFYILRENGGRFKFTAEERSASDYYLRVTFNFHGVLALYFLPKVGNVSWQALWSEPKKVDSGADDCGDNCSTCSLNTEIICKCPSIVFT